MRDPTLRIPVIPGLAVVRATVVPKLVGALLVIVVVGCTSNDAEDSSADSTATSEPSTVSTSGTSSTSQPSSTSSTAVASSTTATSTTATSVPIDPELAAELDQLDALLETSGGRAQVIDAITDAIPDVSRSQASCLLDEVDLEMILALERPSDPLEGMNDLTPEQIASALAALDTCNVALEALLAP